MKALILAGSEITVTDTLRTLCGEAQFIIAADSGVRHAKPLDVIPDLIVGDFDSASEEDLERYPHVPRETHPARKDALDLELALGKASVWGATRLLVVGALGGRLDQTLAALLIAARVHPTCPVIIHDGYSAAYPLKAGEVLTLELPPSTPFSVLSLAPVSVVSLVGSSYPLSQASLEFGVGLGVSNETAASPLQVTLHSGLALLLLDLRERPKTFT